MKIIELTKQSPFFVSSVRLKTLFYNIPFKAPGLIFLMLLCCSFSIIHPFYLGVTDLKYNAKEKSIQGSVKLFTNDLEDALKRKHHQTVDLINGTNKDALNKILSAYVQDHLKVKINSKPVVYNVIGFEHESEAIWIYVEAPAVSVPKKVELSVTLLYDYIQSQINIVHFEVNGKSKSSKITNPDNKITFDF